MPFVKIDETVGSKFPCLECKTLCAGYWYVSSGEFKIKRPCPFCEKCFAKCYNLPKKTQTDLKT